VYKIQILLHGPPDMKQDQPVTQAVSRRF